MPPVDREEYITEMRRIYDRLDEIGKEQSKTNVQLNELVTRYSYTCSTIDSVRIRVKKVEDETPDKINNAVQKPWSIGKKIVAALAGIVTFILAVYGAVFK